MCAIRQEANDRCGNAICDLAGEEGSRGCFRLDYSLEEVEEVVEVDGSTQIVHEVPHAISIELPLFQPVFFVISRGQSLWLYL